MASATASNSKSKEPSKVATLPAKTESKPDKTGELTPKSTSTTKTFDKSTTMPAKTEKDKSTALKTGKDGATTSKTSKTPDKSATLPQKTPEKDKSSKTKPQTSTPSSSAKPPDKSATLPKKTDKDKSKTGKKEDTSSKTASKPASFTKPPDKSATLPKKTEKDKSKTGKKEDTSSKPSSSTKSSDKTATLPKKDKSKTGKTDGTASKPTSKSSTSAKSADKSATLPRKNEKDKSAKGKATAKEPATPLTEKDKTNAAKNGGKPVEKDKPSQAEQNKDEKEKSLALSKVAAKLAAGRVKALQGRNGDSTSSSSMKVLSQVASLPGLLANKVKSTQEKQVEEGELINLTFLTDQERFAIQKVIQADLKLRRNVLGSLKRSIEQARLQQDPLELPSDGNQPLSCAQCGQGVSTICTRVFAGKCSNCGKVVCKKCTGKQMQELSTICLMCKKKRTIQLQTLDYESILLYGNATLAPPDLEGQAKEIPAFAESELIKKSLQVAANLSKTRKSVDFHPGTEGNRSRSGTLPRSTSASITKEGEADKSLSPFTDKRPRSATLPPSKNGSPSPTVPSIHDADCGFKLMAENSDDSLVDLCSVYSEQCYLGVDITGKILLGVWFRAEEQRLYVRCVKAENLAAPVDGSLDPYVKTYLLPGVFKSHKRKTGLQYETTKPVWNETLKYAGLSQEEVRSRTLWVSVWDWNRFGRQQFLGEVRIPLCNRDLTNPKDEWHMLKDVEKQSPVVEEVDSPEQQKEENNENIKGRVLVALKFEEYSPEDLSRMGSNIAGTLGYFRIRVKQAQGLPAMDTNDRADSFARCYLLPNRSLGSKKKSKVVENSLNPVWDDELVYSYVQFEELHSDRSLEVTLWDFDRRGTNQFIGGIRIGPNPYDIVNPYDWMDSTESESNHWESLLDRPGEWVEAWHTLRPTMDSLHVTRKKVRQGSLSSGSLPLGFGEERRTSTPSISSPVPPPKDQALEVNIRRSGKGDYKISGELLVGIKYKDGYLYVKIIKALGLAAVRKNGISSPYVKFYLLPDRSKKSKRKTEVQKKTLEPIYNQAFKYKVDKSDIQMRALWLTIWNWDRMGSSLFLGETCISLAGDLRHSSERWYELHDFAETGMVVMATPFGQTPSHNKHHRFSLTQEALDTSLEHTPQDIPPEQSFNKEGAKPAAAEDPSKTTDIPTVTVEDCDKLTKL